MPKSPKSGQNKIQTKTTKFTPFHLADEAKDAEAKGQT